MSIANDFELAQVLDLKKWQEVQESIAIATNLAIILVDYQGRPITKHSQVHPFCKRVRATPALSKLCEKCDARGGIEAVRTKEPFIYRCHFDIVDIAIPILNGNNYVGAIMAGQIRLQDDQQSLEQVLSVKNSTELQAFKEKYSELYHSLPVFSLSKLQDVAAMLEKISEYIVNESLKKNHLDNAYKQTLRISNKQSLPLDQQETLEEARENIQRSILENRLSDDKNYQAKNKVLQPVIDTIFLNKNEHLSLQDLADLVNLSTSHLSRLLKEEFGEPFSQAYIRLRMLWAKQLLEETNFPINQISEELGYVEASYFVRSFKKTTGITPLHYRKIKNKQI